MLEWFSQERALISVYVIIFLFFTFFISVYLGLKNNDNLNKENVFGDPERTRGGWHWAVCGVSALLLIWFYFSWGMGRAFFPNSGNEMCQIAKIDEAFMPLSAALPQNSRYYKSTKLVVRNSNQLINLKNNLSTVPFEKEEQEELLRIFEDTFLLIEIFSNPKFQSEKISKDLENISNKLKLLSSDLLQDSSNLMPSNEALMQTKWGLGNVEIPLLPITSKGILYEKISIEAKEISNQFFKIRNLSPKTNLMIKKIKEKIDFLKEKNKSINTEKIKLKKRENYIKSIERIFRRVDDGVIFSSSSLELINYRLNDFYLTLNKTKTNFDKFKSYFFPGPDIIKSRTQCSEQGSARWLPKPSDVIATFFQLANPNLKDGGGYKGTTLLWWKWLEISDIISFLIPDFLIDFYPGEYGSHNERGIFKPNIKDYFLSLAQGDIYLGAVPMLDGHIWDSMFRVIIAMLFGILLGVPLGIYMGISRFFKSFFDPLIELYRPVPPLAWAPLILTIFGIQDDGKIFLLFMVSFAIMVISARTGASGTQLSKIRAAHSLGTTNNQILRYVILPNAMPDILTGIRIAIGVCWGTLVAAEMLAGTTGVGFIENVARTVSDYELIWVTILIMGLLGLFFDLIMRWVIFKTIPWRGKG